MGSLFYFASILLISTAFDSQFYFFGYNWQYFMVNFGNIAHRIFLPRVLQFLPIYGIIIL